MHKLVSIVNMETGHTVGLGRFTDVVGAHLRGNYFSMTQYEGVWVKAYFMDDRIEIFPSVSPFVDVTNGVSA